MIALWVLFPFRLWFYLAMGGFMGHRSRDHRNRFLEADWKMLKQPEVNCLFETFSKPVSLSLFFPSCSFGGQCVCVCVCV